MPVRVRIGSLLLHDWKPLEIQSGRWADVFVFDVLPDALLFPPADMGEAIRRMCTSLPKLWKGASLWVRLSAPGRWYAAEMRRALRGTPNLPVAVLPSGVIPRLSDFSLHPYTERAPGSPPLFVEVPGDEIGGYEKRCLLVLARVRTASTLEAASLAGIGKSIARTSLHDLAAQGLVYYSDNGLWHIRPRKGLSKALRMIGLPPGVTLRREKLYGQGRRHRRIARLWLYYSRWLSSFEAWGGWSEPRLLGGRRHPDALSWGILDGKETLFWLEVESGHKSTKILMKQMFRRMNTALVYARGHHLPLVFTLAGPPWVLRAARVALGTVPVDAAVLLLPWSRVSYIPYPVFGQVQPGPVQETFSGLWGSIESIQRISL